MVTVTIGQKMGMILSNFSSDKRKFQFGPVSVMEGAVSAQQISLNWIANNRILSGDHHRARNAPCLPMAK
jgi:hypothetical protein